MMGQGNRGFSALAKKKSEETIRKVDHAIQQLIKENERINFNSISCAAGVSKSYLYNHSDLRERIETLRKQQKVVQQSPRKVKRRMSDESKDAMITLLRERIRELEVENKHLKADNMRLQGKLYEQI